MSSTSSKTGVAHDNRAITPLRQRMIEDMTARKLCAGTQRGHIRSCKRFAAFLKRSPETDHTRGHPSLPAAPGRNGREHLHPQLHHDRAAVLVPVTLRQLDLAAEIYHPQAEAAGDEPGRDEAAAGGRQQPQGARDAQSQATVAACVLGRWCG